MSFRGLGERGRPLYSHFGRRKYIGVERREIPIREGARGRRVHPSRIGFQSAARGILVRGHRLTSCRKCGDCCLAGLTLFTWILVATITSLDKLRLALGLGAAGRKLSPETVDKAVGNPGSRPRCPWHCSHSARTIRKSSGGRLPESCHSSDGAFIAAGRAERRGRRQWSRQSACAGLL